MTSILAVLSRYITYKSYAQYHKNITLTSQPLQLSNNIISEKKNTKTRFSGRQQFLRIHIAVYNVHFQLHIVFNT